MARLTIIFFFCKNFCNQLRKIGIALMSVVSPMCGKSNNYYDLCLAVRLQRMKYVIWFCIDLHVCFQQKLSMQIKIFHKSNWNSLLQCGVTHLVVLPPNGETIQINFHLIIHIVINRCWNENSHYHKWGESEGESN